MKSARVWLALIVAPSLVLGSQMLMFALASPSCASQTRVLIHLVGGGTLALLLVFTLLALGLWRRHAQGRWHAADADLPASMPAFLAGMALAVGALSCLVMLAMWMGAWVLSPCWQ
jgi:hypothetical protein